MMKPQTTAAIAAGGAALIFPLVDYLAFHPPESLADGEACGFVATDFTEGGRLAYAPVHAWMLSFVRQQEYWTVVTIAAAAAFVAYAITTGRLRGTGAAMGAAAGAGLLALSALCVSCLAPVLSLVGLGLATTVLAGLPKWLIAINTLLLTAWGGLAISRRANSCPLPQGPLTPTHLKTGSSR